MTKQQLEQRLSELRAEYKTGQTALSDLENKQVLIRESLRRISEAIRVLEEELSKENSGIRKN